MNYAELPLIRMKVIDDETQRKGRVVVHSEDSLDCMGSLESRFECGSCQALVVVGARMVVGKVLHKCRCGALNEVEGVAPGRTSEATDGPD